MIEVAESKGIEVSKQMLSIEDLLAADEVFLTNSSWHILPVGHIEKTPIGEGKAGPLSKQLREALLEQIAKETSD